MSSAADKLEQNENLARTINQEARNNPKSPYCGKFVGIAHGKVVAVADSLDELDELLTQVEPDASKTLVFEASADYDGPHEIWTN